MTTSCRNLVLDVRRAILIGIPVFFLWGCGDSGSVSDTLTPDVVSPGEPLSTERIGRFAHGVHYRRLAPQKKVTAPAESIEIIEFY